MLHQLQLLEQVIYDIKNRHNIVATELANLKRQTQSGNTHQLQVELNQSHQEISELLATINELSADKAQLEAQVVELTTQNQLLAKENQQLIDKQAIAITRTQALEAWLTKIDNQNI